MIKTTTRLSQNSRIRMNILLIHRRSSAATCDTKRRSDDSSSFSKTYQPNEIESKWRDWWEDRSIFTRSCDEAKGVFSMCLPPPNVTGSLHLGHALGTTVQDVLIRWNRMQGKKCVFVPGTDHAGIATQVVVEKKLWKEKRLKRVEMTRDEFVDEIWKWKNEKGDKILNQLRELGASLDWSRCLFTLDEGHSRAVMEAFIKLYSDGLIRREKSLVNWCCQLSSTLSDIEVDRVEVNGQTNLHIPGYDDPVTFGVLELFDYPILSSNDHITVATTRLETMLGDSAVAVHPNDPRYAQFVGRVVQHPFCERTLPIVADESVNPDFGTGAVKVTPAHSAVDYEIAIRHKLQMYNIMDDSGHMINVPELFMGCPRFNARLLVREALQSHNLYRGCTSHASSVPICSRTGDVVEQFLKDQWFLDTKDMAASAIEFVAKGHLKLIPELFIKHWNQWLETSSLWCLSRQLWWGHQVPMYLAKPMNSRDDESRWFCARSPVEAQNLAKQLFGLPSEEISIRQDCDVLDTWFSSCVYPLSVFGWPNQTDDLQKYYPLSLMETGHDILFFWVARMVMLCHHLTGKLPFNEVLLHGTLRDAHGRKMSKSRGNIINPSDAIYGKDFKSLAKNIEDSGMSKNEVTVAKKGLQLNFPNGFPACGADGLRFTFCSLNVKGDAIHFDPVLLKSNKIFGNKIWQAFRFMLQHIDADFHPVSPLNNEHSYGLVDQWILSRLYHLVSECNSTIRDYNFYLTTRGLRQFFHHEFCDIYLECIKPLLCQDSSEVKYQSLQVLYHCIYTFIHLLCPIMPHLAEELYHSLPGTRDHLSESICIAPYPDSSQFTWRNKDLENSMSDLRLVVNKILNLQKELTLKKNPRVFVKICKEIDTTNHLPLLLDPMKTLSHCEKITLVSKTFEEHLYFRVDINQDYRVFIRTEDFEDIQETLQKLNIQCGHLESSICKTPLKFNQSLGISTNKKVDKLIKDLQNTRNIINHLKTLLHQSQGKEL